MFNVLSHQYFPASSIISQVAEYLVFSIWISIIALCKLFLGEIHLARHRVENFTLVCFGLFLLACFFSFFFLFTKIYSTHSITYFEKPRKQCWGLHNVHVLPLCWSQSKEGRWMERQLCVGGQGSCCFISIFWVLLHTCLFFINDLKSFCKKSRSK